MTTALAAAAGGGCVVSIIGLWLGPFPWILSGTLSAALAPVGLVALTVALGGLVCLWRDQREAAGTHDPLAWIAVEERRPGPLRFLLGSRIRPGDVVRVRPRQDIAKTLDAEGALEGLPFMPEMEPFCGQTFRVHRRVDYINDMRHKTGLRSVPNVVTLTAVRCSGAAHEGCEAECQILWKDAWLERVHETNDVPKRIEALPRCSTERAEPSDRPHFCQMTRLWESSAPLRQWSAGRYLETLRSGNFTVLQVALAALTAVFNWAQEMRRGAGYPYMPPESATGRTPVTVLNLKPGEAVRVISKERVAATLVSGKNRGLWFDRDMIRFCGKQAKVRRQVTRLIHEATGKLVVMKTPCIALENVAATGEFLALCPQHELIYWRESWLERMAPGSEQRQDVTGKPS